MGTRRVTNVLTRPQACRTSSIVPKVTVEILAVLVVMGFAAWVNLPMPLHGDAALYQLGARAMAEGGALYRDFWDLKQPGIYLFHWSAGTLFGFTEVGLHTFELFYMLAFAALQVVVLRRYLALEWLAMAVPVLTVGSYYALSTEWHLTQPAILLSVPLFCVLALLTAPAARWRSLLAGAAGAVAVLFKFAVAPVVLALFVASWLIDRHARGASAGLLWRDRLLPALAGGLAVTGAVVWWLVRYDALQPFIWTLTTWIPLALQVHGAHPVDRIVSSLTWFVETFAPALLLSSFARAGWRGLTEERIFVLALVWLVVGAISVMLEPFAGWQFDFLLLTTPLGIIAVRGVQGLLSMLGEGPGRAAKIRVALVVLALAMLPAGLSWAGKARRMIIHRELATSIDTHAFQRAVSPAYEEIWQATAFLRHDSSLQGSIYVFGDPLIHTLSRRPSASSVHGWAWELQPAVIWQRLESELVAAQPAFVFAEPTYDSMLTHHSPGLRTMLDRDYAVHTIDDLGTWYARRERAPL
jgi:hypothetical protein